MLSTNILKILVYLLIRVSLLTGQFSDRSVSAFSLSLSCFTSSQSCNICSAVCSPILQGHSELSIILYLYRYDLTLPWPVTIIVRFGVTLIFNFNLSATLGKYSFVVTLFVVRSHSICHFVSLFSLVHFSLHCGSCPSVPIHSCQHLPGKDIFVKISCLWYHHEIILRTCISSFRLIIRSLLLIVFLCTIATVNPLTPNDHYSGRTAPLTSKRFILYIYSTNIGIEYFKHGIYSSFFLFKMQFVS